MNLKLYTSILVTCFLSLILASCSDKEKDEPTPNAFTFSLQAEGIEGATISEDGKSASLLIPSDEGDYSFSIAGEYSNSLIESNAEWVSASCANGVITIWVAEYENYPNAPDIRSAEVKFTLFKDKELASGIISISQKSYHATVDDMYTEAQRAIDYFLKDKPCHKTPPTSLNDNAFLAGVDAPWYYMDDLPVVAMKVTAQGEAGFPKSGDKVYFRFERFNLLEYYKSGGVMPQGEGNYPSLTGAPTWFYLDDLTTPESAQWGVGIQMPMMYKQGYGSDIWMVIGPSAGRPEDQYNCVPYLYHLTYFAGDDSDRHVFPPNAYASISFSPEEWLVYGPQSALDFKYFDCTVGIPSGFQFQEWHQTGFGGLMILCDFTGTPKVFDRACPVELDKEIVLSIDTESYTAKCPHCGSTFDVFQGSGIPLSGEAYQKRYGLRQYNIYPQDGGGYLILN